MTIDSIALSIPQTYSISTELPPQSLEQVARAVDTKSSIQQDTSEDIDAIENANTALLNKLVLNDYLKKSEERRMNRQDNIE